MKATLADMAARNEPVVSWKDCPNCDGRGWFLINPFATGGSNGAGGPGNMRQCETCKRVKAYHDANQAIPPTMKTIADAIQAAPGYQPTPAEYEAELTKLREELADEKRNREKAEATLEAALDAEPEPVVFEYESAEFTAEDLPGERVSVRFDPDLGFVLECAISTANVVLGWK